ncbi:hypothetical protein MARPU_05765 [Marichromatium purpuratum 984]|uniref:DUF3168 domain-containing protein n=1 Tax=Marichromatium purpuratum 984 TaxID=765910 RepID=W0E3T1_MARPU|nr:hypothetical protein [Marichromatium purpuratum]AHF05417.1 hypothetical protein MARPU_05765 [Marichromatium purpuratum 984]
MSEQTHPARAPLAAIASALRLIPGVQDVRTGRCALRVSEDEPLPVLTVHSRSEAPATAADRDRLLPVQTWRRSVVIVGHVTATDDWDAELEVLVSAIRRALWAAGVPDLTLGDVIFAPPESGGQIAEVQLEAQYGYQEVLT